MPMSEDYRAALDAWLKKFGAPPCPFCRETRWELGYITLLLDGESIGRQDQGGAVGYGLPAAPLLCGSCGYIALMSAWKLGLTPPPPRRD